MTELFFSRKLTMLLLVLACIAIAWYVRLHFLLIRGGLEPDQIGWATTVYYGGISKAYVAMRDALLAGQVGSRIWGYMPGYPALLAILGLGGLKDLGAVRVAQTFFDAIAILPLVYVVTQLTRSFLLAIFAATLYAASPWLAQGSGYLLAESLVPALVVWTLAGMIWLRGHPASGIAWSALGLFCAILPFFRSEFILLVFPLVVWSLMVAPRRRRAYSALAVATAFLAPVIAWGLRNHLMHGHFALVPSAGWYAMWAGLGQVANDFGYHVDDLLASEMLQKKAILWHTAESELFWKNEYLNALREHPRHVWQAFQFRMQFIATRCDYSSVPLRSICDLNYYWFAWLSLLAVVWLAWKRRWSDAFLICGPMAFALLSLGFIYVEPRYVRYAGITYLLGAVVFVALLADLVAVRFTALDKRARSLSIKNAVGAVGAALVAIYLGTEHAALRNAAYRGVIAADKNEQILQSGDTADVQPLTLLPATPAVTASISPDGLDVAATTRISYLIVAEVNAKKAEVAVIGYRIKLMAGELMIGMLSGDQQRFLGNEPVARTPEPLHEGNFRIPVEEASTLVFSGSNSYERETRFQVQRFEMILLCREGSFGFAPKYLFGKTDLPKTGICGRRVLQY
jgi:hypothetical protein